MASFERAYWFLEPNFQQDQKELTTAALRSVAVNYIHSRCPIPPKGLVKAIHRLNRRNDIVISKPDKGSGVVIMNKDDYLRLLADASVNNQSKFRPCSTEKPKSRGRPPKNYHPLLEKEKELNTVVKKILPKTTADNICSKGSRLAHLYGLPKMHKKDPAMRPVLSATDTYNYNLAKW